MPQTPFQIFAAKMICNIINEEHDAFQNNQTGIKDVLTYLIRHYSEFAHDGQKSYKDVKRYQLFHKFTLRAFEKFNEAVKKGVTFSEMVKKGQKKVLFYEHCPPVDVLKHRLLKIYNQYKAITVDQITEIMSVAEVIIISIDEEKCLRTPVHTKCSLDGKERFGCGMIKTGTLQERLDCLEAILCPSFSRNHITNKIAVKSP